MDKVTDILNTLNLPYAYHHFKEGEAPNPPFLVYYRQKSPNFSADGISYYGINNINLELYTDKKDKTTEALVETALTNAGVFFITDEYWIEDEKLYEVLYQFSMEV